MVLSQDTAGKGRAALTRSAGDSWEKGRWPPGAHSTDASSRMSIPSKGVNNLTSALQILELNSFSYKLRYKLNESTVCATSFVLMKGLPPSAKGDVEKQGSGWGDPEGI